MSTSVSSRSLIALRLLLSFFVLSGCAVKKLSIEPGNPKWGMDVTWHGHSCFSLRDSVGRTIVLDPFDETVGYGRIHLFADALFISHQHFDHNYVSAVKARLKDIDIVRSSGTVSVASGLQVTGIPSDHDSQGGEIHGPNLIYLFVIGGLRVVFLGDFGQTELTDFQLKMISKVDVLFVPVGGFTVLGAKQAKRIVDELKPSVVFPMHFGDVRFYPFEKVEAFSALFSTEQIRSLGSSSVRIRESDLTDKPIVYILESSAHN